MAHPRTLLVAGFNTANMADLQPVLTRLADLNWRIDFVAGLELEEERPVKPPQAVSGRYFPSATQVAPPGNTLDAEAIRSGHSRAAAHRRLLYDADWVARVATEIAAIPAAASALLSASRPALAVLPETTDIARGRPWALALQALNLPTLVHWPSWYNLFSEYPVPTDTLADRYLVYSDRSRRRLGRRGVSMNRIRVVGSPRFAALRLRRERRRGRTVLFIAQHREETPYYCHQLGVATARLGLPLVIKPHPLDRMTAATLTRVAALATSARIERERPLAQLLAEAACVVTISSSVMFDAVAANIPVIALRYALTLDELELGLGGGCVRVARNLGELKSHLARLDHGVLAQSMKQRQRFLGDYLGPMDDRAVDRVVAEINAMAGTQATPHHPGQPGHPV